MGEWIENTGGVLIPSGLVVDIEFEDGDTLFGYVSQSIGDFQTTRGEWFHSYPDFSWPRDYDGQCVARYRLHDDGQSEAETRKARMADFYKIAAGRDHLIEETLKTRKPVSAPQKAGE